MPVGVLSNPVSNLHTEGVTDFKQILKRVKEHFTKDSTLFKPIRSRRNSGPTTPLPEAFVVKNLDNTTPLIGLISSGSIKNDTASVVGLKSKRCSVPDIELPKELLDKLAEAGFLPLGPIQPLQQPPPLNSAKKQRPRPHNIDTALGKTPLNDVRTKMGNNHVPVAAKGAAVIPARPSVLPNKLAKVVAEQPKGSNQEDKPVAADYEDAYQKAKDKMKKIPKPSIIQFAETYKATMTKVRYVNYYPLQQRMQIKLFKKTIEDKKQEIVRQCERVQQVTKQRENFLRQKAILSNLHWGKEANEKIRERCITLMNKVGALMIEQENLGRAFIQSLLEATGLGKDDPLNAITFREMNVFLQLMQVTPQQPAVVEKKTQQMQKLLSASPPCASDQQPKGRKTVKVESRAKSNVVQEKQQFKKRSKPQRQIPHRTPEQIQQRLEDIFEKNKNKNKSLADEDHHECHLNPEEFDYRKHYPHLPPPLIQHRHIDEFHKLLATDMYDYKTCKTPNDVVILQKRWRHSRYMTLLVGVDIASVPDQQHPVAYALKRRRKTTYQEKTISVLWDGTVKPLTATASKWRINKKISGWFTKQRGAAATAATTNITRKTSQKRRASLRRKRFKKLRALNAAVLTAAVVQGSGLASRSHWSLMLFHSTIKRRRDSMKSIKH